MTLDPAWLDAAKGPFATLSPEEARWALGELANEVRGCTRCAELAATRTNTVFGVGNPAPEICFVGEAPGFNEDKQAEPFVGQAGQLLTKIIRALGLQRSDVYICNTLKCRPPENRKPAPGELLNCRPYLESQLMILRPRVICCLGATAAQALLGISEGMGRMRGKWYEYRGTPVTVTYHPAFLLRQPAMKREVWQDMVRLMAFLGRPVPARAITQEPPAGRSTDGPELHA